MSAAPTPTEGSCAVGWKGPALPIRQVAVNRRTGDLPRPVPGVWGLPPEQMRTRRTLTPCPIRESATSGLLVVAFWVAPRGLDAAARRAEARAPK
jgi:hypothetical protein